MQRWFLIFIIVFMFFLSGAFAQSETPVTPNLSSSKTLLIGRGESVRVDVPPGAKVHISDGSVVRSRVIGRTVLMTGKRLGKTSLRIIQQARPGGRPAGFAGDDKTIIVTEKKTATAARRFQEKIADGRGLKFNYEALPALIVTGELLRLDDWQRLVAIARESKTAWRLESTVFGSLRSEFRKKIEAELTRLAWPGQRLSIDENGPTLTGGTESASLSAEQKLSVTTLGVQLESSNGITELEPMVRTQIVIAEVRRNRVRELGIKWPDVATASVLPSLQIPTSALMLDLQAMEQEGEGRILAMPTLLCRSGGEAKFLAGGEIPIKLTSVRSSQVEWKKYGITLHVQPKADRMKRMKFQLSTEISTLDKATELDGVPGILTNRIETQFNLSGPQTIVLSGLIKREEGSAATGVPFLRSIPILGGLFASENFRKSLTELIIFVSPEVIVPGSEGTHD